MTWNIRYATRGAFIHDEPDEKQDTPVPWEKDQMLVARAAADVILKSVAVGTESYDCSIELSGHGNKNHQPAAEGEDATEADAITVTVTQLTLADLEAQTQAQPKGKRSRASAE